jgi:hypothetical protein
MIEIFDRPPMKPGLLVVARGGAALNIFEQSSLQEAINTRDFLEQTGDYDEVSIFQLLPADGRMKDWVKLSEPES